MKKKTTEEFVTEAKIIWGDKYDYSLVEYIGANKKIKIIYEGIIYEQLPSTHLNGARPEKFNKLKTNEEFICASKLIWGDKYDYSLVEYKGNNKKVKFIYNGIIYKQTPNSHLDGNSPERLNKLKTNKEFIDESNVVHNYKYDYSKTIYVGVMKTIIVIYNGVEYQQIANDHLHGHRPEVSHTTKNTQHFIQKANKIWNNKYNYSKTIYKNQKTKVIIIYDGVEYLQTPQQHIQGFMPELILKLSQDEFLRRCMIIHNNKFDYSLVVYKNIYSVIKIIFEGKIYEQVASNHMAGYVPIELAPISKGEEQIKYILDKYNIRYIQQYKYINCRNILELRFDFYLPDYNILIEFDGKQHFKPQKYFGGEIGYECRIMCDNIKNIYAELNKIPLLRISYLDYKNIEKILIEYLKLEITILI